MTGPFPGTDPKHPNHAVKLASWHDACMHASYARLARPVARRPVLGVGRRESGRSSRASRGRRRGRRGGRGGRRHARGTGAEGGGRRAQGRKGRHRPGRWPLAAGRYPGRHRASYPGRASVTLALHARRHRYFSGASARHARQLNMSCESGCLAGFAGWQHEQATGLAGRTSTLARQRPRSPTSIEHRGRAACTFPARPRPLPLSLPLHLCLCALSRARRPAASCQPEPAERRAQSPCLCSHSRSSPPHRCQLLPSRRLGRPGKGQKGPKHFTRCAAVSVRIGIGRMRAT